MWCFLVRDEVVEEDVDPASPVAALIGLNASSNCPQTLVPQTGQRVAAQSGGVALAKELRQSRVVRRSELARGEPGLVSG